jgi:hypothetical protein
VCAFLLDKNNKNKNNPKMSDNKKNDYTPKLEKKQILELAERFTKELGTPEFMNRLSTRIAGLGPMDADKLFDELENMQKFMYAEWDLYPHVSPDEMLDDLHAAATVFKDNDTHATLDKMCSRIQHVLNTVGGAHQQKYGGNMQPQHGHTHNGQPCNGSHGHSHGNGNMMQQPNPVQLQIMNMAVTMTLSEEERQYFAESQRTLMFQGPGAIDQQRREKMGQLQQRVMMFVQKHGPLISQQMEAGFKTALTKEEQKLSEETQKKIQKGEKPSDEVMKKMQEYQVKVMAYVQTMMTFLVGPQIPTTAKATATPTTTTNSANSAGASKKE